MVFNGKDEHLDFSVNLSDYLAGKGINIARVAVELNGVILSRDEFKDTVIDNNDKLEVVSFVGGG